LLFSVLVRPAAAVPAHLFVSALGVSILDAVRSRVEGGFALKWPNDIVLRSAGMPDRKVCGILAESIVDGGHIAAVVVGAGINVNWPEIPEELAETAVALNHLSGAELDRRELLEDIIVRFERALDDLELAGGPGRLSQQVRDRSATLGARVRVELSTESFEGLAESLTDEGHLLVRTDSELREVAFGDVIHLRPIETS
jgi:BirA family biotin operon repressor/biotin-[acetyl-CoA-carboxylase] ligase